MRQILEHVGKRKTAPLIAPACLPPLAGGYRAPLAQQRAAGLARTARYPSRLAQDGPLWGYGARLLRDRHSPQQISGILCQMQPDDLTHQISHETIYAALYAMPRGELRTELIACLRQARKSRRPRARGADRRGTIPNMVSIHMRPPEIVPFSSAPAARCCASAVSTPVARADCGVVKLGCVSGTCGGARVGVVQAPVGCGESCGLQILVYGNCAVSACLGAQPCQKLSKRSL